VPTAARLNCLSRLTDTAPEFQGSKKLLILQPFRPVASCEPSTRRLLSTRRKDATADAKGFAKGQWKEPPRADGLAPPSSLNHAGIPASPKDGDTFAARPKDSGIALGMRHARRHLKTFP
jgi:hypothetical protein